MITRVVALFAALPLASLAGPSFADDHGSVGEVARMPVEAVGMGPELLERRRISVVIERRWLARGML